MITIFGAPGAGKTIQGQLLARKYNWEWISYRDLLYGLGDKDIVYAIEHGLFIDDDVAIKVVLNTLRSLRRDAAAPTGIMDLFDLKRGRGIKREIILDGFPADYRQVKWLIENKEIENLTGAIVLRVPRGELWKRLVERKRVDDTRATIERRQDAYERNITGMIRTLTMNGVKVREVDGGNSPEDVLLRIEEVLGDWGLISKKQFLKISQN